MKSLVYMICVFIVLFISAASADMLRLENYLDQVKTSNHAFRSAKEIGSASELISEKNILLVFPSVFGQVQQLSDSRETTNPIFQGDKSQALNYQLGISEQTPIGLDAKLYYDMTKTKISGASSTFVQIPSYFEGKAVLELKQSLLKNGFGESVRAHLDLIESQAMAQSYSERFKMRTTLADAEGVYWRLTLARESVEVTQESLKRAVKIRDWNDRRTRLQLADKSDLLQSEAVVRLREMELQSALDELRAASQAFNLAREVSGDEVVEKLEKISAKKIEALLMPKRVGDREDVLAAKEQSQASIASNRMDRSTLKPQLDLYGTYSLNGRDREQGESFSESLGTTRPLWSVGVRFSFPLNVVAAFDSAKGHRQAQVGAELAVDRKLYEQERDWQDLTRKFTEAKNRFAFAKAIEDAQTEKVMHERSRHEKGRTTTYQVLMFEQDFAAAQLNRIRAEADVYKVSAAMKTYSGEKL